VKVLGIDPGTASCGFGVVVERDGRLLEVCHGVIKTPAGQRMELRLRTIFVAVQELINEHQPDELALEESFVGADPRTALMVGQARGAIMVAGSLAGLECTEHAPSRVKQTVAGHGRAGKAEVQRMVQILLSLPKPPTPDHAADALAVAICHVLASPLLKASTR